VGWGCAVVEGFGGVDDPVVDLAQCCVVSALGAVVEFAPKVCSVGRWLRVEAVEPLESGFPLGGGGPWVVLLYQFQVCFCARRFGGMAACLVGP
jgi:hypothetical protein